nr:gas vesicle protein GvpD [Candidatus Njordarchaeota archaeon]
MADLRKVVSSGISSLDKIIEGGFNEGDVILVAGQPGAGKSTLGVQFIYNGATQHDEAGVYATYVETSSKLKRDMLKFNWDLASLESERKVSILDLVQTISEKGVEVNIEAMMTAIKALGAKRLVIDSLSAIMTYIRTKSDARSAMSIINRFLENAKCTTLMLLEVPWGRSEIGMGFEEFMADGLVVLESSLERYKVRRKLYIPKMRGVNHALDCYDFFITTEGISVSPIPATKQ